MCEAVASLPMEGGFPPLCQSRFPRRGPLAVSALPVKLPPLVEPAASLTVDEVRRYSRHLIIPDVAMDGQKRLKNAKVLCIGAGGLGSPALMYLAAAGVGTLGIVEFDTVDESNLQRQIIHGQSDIGRSKAESARDSVKEINPLVQVNVHEERLDSENVMELFAQYDLIVDGTDNFATRYLVNDACVLLNKPYVWGSIYRFDGQASVFWSEYGPCYRCLYPEPPPPGMVPSCAEGGVLGVLCASIGSIQVTEAIKVLTGTGEPLVGRLMIYDALEMSYRSVKVRKDPECAVCGKNPTVTELIDYEAFCGAVSEEAVEAAKDSTITPRTLKQWIDEGQNLEIIDVREPAEWEIVHIDGAKLVPKNEFLIGEALADLPQDKKIVLHCKSGVRSAEVLALVKAAGFSDAVHVGSGIVGWVNQVEPQKPIY
jgi:adenylyltransferase/sulfurtransferase